MGDRPTADVICRAKPDLRTASFGVGRSPLRSGLPLTPDLTRGHRRLAIPVPLGAAISHSLTGIKQVRSDIPFQERPQHHLGTWAEVHSVAEQHRLDRSGFGVRASSGNGRDDAGGFPGFHGRRGFRLQVWCVRAPTSRFARTYGLRRQIVRRRGQNSSARSATAP